MMKVLTVSAHPRRDSLTTALHDIAVATLTGDGHEVKSSRLYEMGWKAAADEADFGDTTAGDSSFMFASGEAFDNGSLSPDIQAEQDKLRWADTVLLHFPLWWFSMPAIMKGWVDRVLTMGFGYGTGPAAKRYGGGLLDGKRAMLVVAVGGREENYAARGINGPIQDLLFPIEHGIFSYTGMEVLPAHVVFSANRVTPQRFADLADELRERMSTLDKIEPVPFRRGDSGDYHDRVLTLRDGLETPGTTGFDLHRRIAR
jgi:NAD(P)H dehydrogenase (quinone)